MHHEFAHSKISRKSLAKWLPAALITLALGIALSSFTTPAFAERSVPAELLKTVSLPGDSDHFSRPAAIFVDEHSGEILFADSGNNRIVIFDKNGTYRFEFSGDESFASPSDVVVDSEGFIYVLGATTEGRRIRRYDFDGTSPEEFPLPTMADDSSPRLRSLAISADDRLCALDGSSAHVLVLSTQGELLNTIDLLGDEDEAARNELVVGSIHVSGGSLYAPISSVGSVKLYDLDGGFVRSIGYRGNNIGELNFPVAVATISNEMVLILDKHRFNVLCFSFDGRFLGEFGGKGMRPGWFYHPTLLAVDSNELVYVGQIFESRVDVCQIPSFIQDAQSRSAEKGTALSNSTPLRVAWTNPSTLAYGRASIE